MLVGRKGKVAAIPANGNVKSTSESEGARAPQKSEASSKYPRVMHDLNFQLKKNGVVILTKGTGKSTSESEASSKSDDEVSTIRPSENEGHAGYERGMDHLDRASPPKQFKLVAVHVKCLTRVDNEEDALVVRRSSNGAKGSREDLPDNATMSKDGLGDEVSRTIERLTSTARKAICDGGPALNMRIISRC